MKAAMHIGARTMKTRSIKASSWRKGKGKATSPLRESPQGAALGTPSYMPGQDAR